MIRRPPRGSTVQPGAIIEGKYQLVRQIGEGGMGVVFEARNVRIGLRVALKFILPELAQSQQAVARLIREAQAAAALGSDHIVRVLDVGDAAGLPFVVMEYLEGRNLADVLAADGTLDPGRATALVVQACVGLEAAHSKGFVHRDLKPENLFLTRADDGSERVKVLDFGIAKALDSSSGQVPRLTKEGMTLGTLFYMAPEQLWNAKGSDRRADVYALGVVLYELLTGRLPFVADTQSELVLRIATTRPVPPRQLRPDLDGALEAVIAKAMAKEVEARFQSAAELAAALAPFAARANAPWGSNPPVLDAVGPTARALPAVEPPVSPAPPAIPATEPPGARWAEDVPREPTGPTPLIGYEPTERATPGRFVPRTMQVPTPSTPFTVEQPLTGDFRPVRPRTALIVVGAFGALAVVGILVGLGIWLATRSGAESAPSALPRSTAPAATGPGAPSAVPGSAAPAASPDASVPANNPNPWVRVDPPATPVVLGVASADAPPEVRGFRPSRGISAPTYPFEIQRHEVTWAELLPWLRARPDVEAPPEASRAADPAVPATSVSWPTAVQYCRSLGGDLPTEEEWELAARGAARRPAPWGAEPLDPSRTHAYRPDQPLSAAATSPQDVTPPPQSVHDLAGNAQEWTSSLFREDHPGQDESWVRAEGVTFRTVRGLPPHAARPARVPAEPAAYREALCATGPCPPSTADVLRTVGFRCARRVPGVR